MTQPNGDFAAGAEDAARVTGHSDTAAALEELADDMLGVMQRLEQIEQRQVTLDESVRALGSGATRSIDALRRDLIGEHRALSLRQFANAVGPALDSLITVRRGIDPREDS